MLCAKFGWNWPRGSGEEDFFKNLSMYFHYFVIISPWKRAGPFICINLNSLHPIGWNWPNGSGEKVENVNWIALNGDSLKCTYIQWNGDWKVTEWRLSVFTELWRFVFELAWTVFLMVKRDIAITFEKRITIRSSLYFCSWDYNGF